MSASVMIGTGLSLPRAIMMIISPFALFIALLVAMRRAHDCTKHNNAELIDSHFDQIGRMPALFLGTTALDIIVTGAQTTGFAQPSLP